VNYPFKLVIHLYVISHTNILKGTLLNFVNQCLVNHRCLILWNKWYSLFSISTKYF